MTPAPGSVGWGILGAARIVESDFLPALGLARNGHLAALGSRRLDRARAFADRAGEGEAVASYDAVLEHPGVEAVYVALPNALHAEWIVRALEAGKHVLCEKPVVLSSEELERVRRAASAAGRTVMEAWRYRFHPQYESEGWSECLDAIGPLAGAHAQASFVLDDPGDIRSHAELGGGAVWDIGCYCLSFLTWLLGGDAQPRADVSHRGGVDWSAAVALRWDGGAAATATWSFGAARSQQVSLYGERGVLSLFAPFWERPGVAGRLWAGGDEREVHLPVANCFQREIEHFGDVVRGAAPAITLDESAEWLRLAEAVLAERPSAAV